MSNYNHIAWAYDGLARVVYGRKLARAKQAFLEEIPTQAKILVIGGGTGEIIDHLQKMSSYGEIDFIETSKHMIRRAEKRDRSKLEVNFYQQPILEFEKTGYDCILVNFFFDQFSLPEAQHILRHVKAKLNRDGVLIFSDFIATSNYWDRLITRVMYLFFKITTGISAGALLSHDVLFSSAGFYARSTKKISRNILAIAYSLEPPKRRSPSHLKSYT
jgi:ubiquinone/menaquinone biosynthesis C-methylase UbiE